MENELVEDYNYHQRKKLLNVNLLLLLLLIIKKKNKRKRRFWVRNIFKNRRQQGDFYNLLQEMRLSDEEKHFNYLRMSKENFDTLLSIVGTKLTRKWSVREPISAAERLALTIRYLASGDSMVSMSYAFRIGKSTASQIIQETCSVLWDCLHESVLLVPNETSWKKIADNFNKEWNLPNCVGAVDGKQVVTQALPNSGSTYYNYKGSHSIILMAMCDANYKFTLVDIGAPGRQSDGGVFKNSNFGKLLSENKLHLPAPSPIEYAGEPMNYYIVADEAFPLTPNIMRPYPGRYLPQSLRIANYRFSRGRRCIENSFGILASRWRIYRKPIICSLCTLENIIKATVSLHNWLMIANEASHNGKRYCPSNFVDREDSNGEIISGEWRNEIDATPNNLLPINRISSNMYQRSAHDMREALKNYFMFEGAVNFQWEK